MTTFEDVLRATMELCENTPGAGKVYDHVIWPNKQNLAEFKKVVGDPDTGDFNVVFCHMSNFNNENPNVFSLDRGQDIVEVEIHHVRGLNNQFDDSKNSVRLFRLYLQRLVSAWKAPANRSLGTGDPQVSHTALRTLGRMTPVSEYGPFVVHYGILVFQALINSFEVNTP